MQNECGLSAAWSPNGGAPRPPEFKFIAIWDTGATNSVITENCINACGLSATGMVEVHGVHGSQWVETYLVNISLPNQVQFVGVTVTKGAINGADLLIGMDIISQGDFSVTNVGGNTKFSFRTPSVAHIDYVQEANDYTTNQNKNARKASAQKRRARYLR